MSNIKDLTLLLTPEGDDSVLASSNDGTTGRFLLDTLVNYFSEELKKELNAYVDQKFEEQLADYVKRADLSTSSSYTKANGDSDISKSGSSQPHDNMPPYTAVYAWRRIA